MDRFLYHDVDPKANVKFSASKLLPNKATTHDSSHFLSVKDTEAENDKNALLLLHQKGVNVSSAFRIIKNEGNDDCKVAGIADKEFEKFSEEVRLLKLKSFQNKK